MDADDQAEEAWAEVPLSDVVGASVEVQASGEAVAALMLGLQQLEAQLNQLYPHEEISNRIGQGLKLA